MDRKIYAFQYLKKKIFIESVENNTEILDEKSDENQRINEPIIATRSYLQKLLYQMLFVLLKSVILETISNNKLIMNRNIKGSLFAHIEEKIWQKKSILKLLQKKIH